MVGAIVSYSSSGLLCVYGFGNGWESIFYVHGTAYSIALTCACTRFNWSNNSISMNFESLEIVIEIEYIIELVFFVQGI